MISNTFKAIEAYKKQLSAEDLDTFLEEKETGKRAPANAPRYYCLPDVPVINVQGSGNEEKHWISIPVWDEDDREYILTFCSYEIEKTMAVAKRYLDVYRKDKKRRLERCF